jgi:hypothetical protein
MIFSQSEVGFEFGHSLTQQTLLRRFPLSNFLPDLLKGCLIEILLLVHHFLMLLNQIIHLVRLALQLSIIQIRLANTTLDVVSIFTLRQSNVLLNTTRQLVEELSAESFTVSLKYLLDLILVSPNKIQTLPTVLFFPNTFNFEFCEFD